MAAASAPSTSGAGTLSSTLGLTNGTTNYQTNSTRADLAARGVRFCLQGHAVLAAIAKAMHDTYTHFRNGGTADGLKPILATPEEMARLIGKAEYERLSENYLN